MPWQTQRKRPSCKIHEAEIIVYFRLRLVYFFLVSRQCPTD